MSTEIIEGNKLIAEIMGAKLTLRNNELAVFVDESCLFKEYFRVTKWNRYHSDWNELMSVYYKIVFELMWDMNGKDQEYINGVIKNFNIINTIFISPAFESKELHMEAVWIAFVEFAKWYQNQILNNTINHGC